jgi:mannosyl-oligosaccharide alpha-1,2-mannosidase
MNLCHVVLIHSYSQFSRDPAARPMLATHTLVFALGAFLSLPQTILGGLVQSQSLVFPPEIDATANLDNIRQIFTDSYAVYK